MLQTILTAATGSLSALLVFLGGAYATRTKRADDDRDNDREDAEHADARWQAMLDNQRRDFELLLAPMRDRIDGLETKVSHLEAALDRIRGLYRAAIDHIRAWRVWASGPRTEPMPELPAELHEEV